MRHLSSQQPASHPPERTFSAWFGFARRVPTGRGTLKIRVLWKRVLVLLACVAVSLWLLKSIGLFYFFREIREFEEVSFTDMLTFPLNRENVRLQQGDYQIRQAEEAMEREDYWRAFSLFREGLARSPGNLNGRIQLARVYSGWRPDLAAELLLEGLPYGSSNPEFVRFLFQILVLQKKDSEILQVSEALLNGPASEDIRRIAAVARLQSAIHTGRMDIARTVFESTDLESTLDGVLLGTELYMRAGREAMATAILEAIIDSRLPGNLDPVYTQLIRILKARELYDEARQRALELVIRNPLDWGPRLQLIDILALSGRIARRDQELEAFLQEYRNDEVALVRLAQLCSEHGMVEGTSRLYEIALENGYNLAAFTLSLVEAHVRDGQPLKAIGLCNELVREDPTWLINSESVFNAIRSLAYYQGGEPDLGRLYLKNFLDSRRTEAETLLQAARSFQDFGFLQQARQVLEVAHARNPHDENVLSLLIDVEMELGSFFNLDQHLRQLFQLRRPGYDELEDFHSRLKSDRFIFVPERESLLEDLASIIAEQEQMDWDVWETTVPRPPDS